MKTPRYLLGAALLFWGWQTGWLIWAAPMAMLAEASHFVRARWDFSLTDLKRIWNLCAVLFFGVGFALYSSEETSRVALKFAQWTPFLFYPMLLAQAYGSCEKIPLSVFSWFLRRIPERPLAKKSFNISYLYFAACLLAASATSRTDSFFYPGVVLLIGLALMANRPMRLPAPVWIGLIALVAVAGHFGHQQLHALHANVEGALARWFVGLFNRQPNLEESQTAIGRVGRISLSGNIVLRVQPEPAGSPPTLLREASYDLYKNGVWRSSQSEFVTVFVETNDVAVLQEPKKLNFAVRIAGYLRGGRGQLALPHGAYELQNFPAVLETNRLGIAKIQEGPGLLNLTAYYGPGKSCDAPANTNADLEIPRNEKLVLAQIARELNLDGQSERKKIEIIGKFFREQFAYSTEITRRHVDRSGQKTPLGQFLTVTRSGHCEYFATATVLLLRQAKIPARYATGYIVDESARRGSTYLVRERDGHAWAMIYRKGVWEEFDTTPASTNRAQNFNASTWEPISDFFANLKFQFSKWRWSKTTYTQYVSYLLIPLVLFLVWRILSKRRRQQTGPPPKSGSDAPVWPGADSEFYLFDEKMTAAGLGRQPNELSRQWQWRLETAVMEPERVARIFQLHHRLRFDPQGLTTTDRGMLRSEVKQWMDAFEFKKMALEKMNEANPGNDQDCQK